MTNLILLLLIILLASFFIDYKLHKIRRTEKMTNWQNILYSLNIFITLALTLSWVTLVIYVYRSAHGK